MTKPSDVRTSYDSAATAYAEHLFNELDQKPVDRHILDRFAESLSGAGLVADLGCGPGHIAKYLHERGVSIVGVDLSPEMVRSAAERVPGVEFRTGDMHKLDLPDASLAGIVAFYSIVHFEPEELEQIFRECRRVLADDGLMLLAFHIGDETVHLDEMWGKPVNLDFCFHQPDDVIASLNLANLIVTESVEREPYEDAEYPSRRCYLLATAD
jgi:ubiquinone/menaquinone biosynthesis C-methylase UbiE